MAVQVKFVATASSTGGRHGHASTDDGVVCVDLQIPEAFGGIARPGATTPEHLFAAGYAACFGSALEHVAAQKKLPGKQIRVDAAVGIGPNGDGGFGLNVTLTVHVPGMSEQDVRALIQAADEICPYSNAVRGNVEVSLRTGTS